MSQDGGDEGMSQDGGDEGISKDGVTGNVTGWR